MKSYYTQPIEKSPRIGALIDTLYKNMPEIEALLRGFIDGKLPRNGGRTDHHSPRKGVLPYLQAHPHHHPRRGADCRERDKGAARVPGVPGVLVRVARGRV